jgi:hypothetical protein
VQRAQLAAECPAQGPAGAEKQDFWAASDHDNARETIRRRKRLPVPDLY